MHRTSKFLCSRNLCKQDHYDIPTSRLRNINLLGPDNVVTLSHPQFYCMFYFIFTTQMLTRCKPSECSVLDKCPRKSAGISPRNLLLEICWAGFVDTLLYICATNQERLTFDISAYCLRQFVIPVYDHKLMQWSSNVKIAFLLRN